MIKKLPKVSVITVSYNSEKYIETAIQSVLSQDYENIEYNIVDGASSDNTVYLINKYSSQIQNVVSEPDKGLYYAMNKGIDLSTGDLIAFLNSDDLYVNESVISKIVNHFVENQADIIFADLYYVNQVDINKIVRKWSSGEYKKGEFKRGWHPPHPTFIVKKEIYKEYGKFNTNFKLASDFEIMLRLMECYDFKIVYYPEPIIKMRLGGATNKNIKNIINQNRECKRAFKLNNLNVSFMYPLFRLIPKLKQFFA